jgi:hypothetical protein
MTRIYASIESLHECGEKYQLEAGFSKKVRHFSWGLLPTDTALSKENHRQ